MSITKIITRRLNFNEHKVWFTSNAIKSDYDNKWSNTFYIHFAKEDYPEINYPKLVEKNLFGRKQMGFDYMEENDLANLNWHGGITFYEETTLVESGKNYVKAGCDYQHYMDDHWQLDDNGEEILKMESSVILRQFLDIVELRKKNHEK